MTLEEKVGQMTQITLNVISEGGFKDIKYPHAIDTARLNSAILKYKVGSILNTSDQAQTLEHWKEIITQIQNLSVNKTRLGIPVLYGIDAIHGTNYTLGATLFPQQITQAAGWNTNLVEKIGSITAYETRASSIPWSFSPVLGLGRNPVWSRFWETFGEDVYLVSQMGKAMIKGYQGNDMENPEKVASCLKHYAGYSMPLSGKDRTQAWIPEIYMQEYFLVPFKKAIKAGSLTLMINSSEVNGTPLHASYHYLTEILKKELGFKGFAVTDWSDIKFLHKRHKIADSQKEAVKIAVNAGIDMSMVPNDFSFAKYLIELVNEGEVPMSRINDAVRRILYVKMKLGLFKTPVTNYKDYPKFGCEEFQKVSLESAIESMTLLKNTNGLLPLSKDKKILVTGPTANSMRCLNGGWSYTWQGEQTDKYTKNKNTVLEAIQAKIGKDKVLYSEGTSFDKDINTNKTVSLAKQSDIIVMCLGENSYTEKPGDISDLRLPKAQLKLAAELAKTGKPLVLVLLEGRPRIINEIEAATDAILMAYLPGNEGGDALAEVLFGDASPSGKLPFTYPRHTNALLTYDHKYTDEVESRIGVKGFNPQFEFGFGLTYTTFEYTNLQLSSSKLDKNGVLTIKVDLTNTGNKDGKEVVQLYVSDLFADITPPVKRLRGFEKVFLKSKETKTVTFKIDAKDIAYVNNKLKWITQKGEFKVSIGNLNTNFSFE
jgi:beta-glucosidase